MKKGESYKLIWPAKPEFVRTAIRHGAVIIPMAAVGGDEFIKILLDQQEVLTLPIIGEQLNRLGNQMPHVRYPPNSLKLPRYDPFFATRIDNSHFHINQRVISIECSGN